MYNPLAPSPNLATKRWLSETKRNIRKIQNGKGNWEHSPHWAQKKTEQRKPILTVLKLQVLPSKTN